MCSVIQVSKKGLLWSCLMQDVVSILIIGHGFPFDITCLVFLGNINTIIQNNNQKVFNKLLRLVISRVLCCPKCVCFVLFCFIIVIVSFVLIVNYHVFLLYLVYHFSLILSFISFTQYTKSFNKRQNVKTNKLWKRSHCIYDIV